MFNEVYGGFTISQAVGNEEWGYYASLNTANLGGGYIWKDGTINSQCSGGSMQGWHPTVEGLKAIIDKYNGVKPKRVKPRKIFYKVCYAPKAEGLFGRLFSAARGLPDSYETEYKVGEVTKPRVAGTRLFVFDNLNAARAFVGSEMFTARVQIFECEVKDPKKVKFLTSMLSADRYWEVVAAYRKKRKGKLIDALRRAIYNNRDIPQNSYTVTEVKLLKPVAVKERSSYTIKDL